MKSVILIAICMLVVVGGVMFVEAVDSAQNNTTKQKIKSAKFKEGEMVEMKLDNREGMIVGVNTYTKNITYNIKFIYDDNKQYGNTLGSASRKKEFYTTEYHIESYEIQKQQDL